MLHQLLVLPHFSQYLLVEVLLSKIRGSIILNLMEIGRVVWTPLLKDKRKQIPLEYVHLIFKRALK
jgi:hypothetical protein